MSERILELIRDSTLGIEKQVNYICKSYDYQIRNISFICKYINDDTGKTIISRLDFGDFRYIPLTVTNRLQRV